MKLLILISLLLSSINLFAQEATLNICERNKAVVKSILEALRQDDCSNVSTAKLSESDTFNLKLTQEDITTITSADFNGIKNIGYLSISGDFQTFPKNFLPKLPFTDSFPISETEKVRYIRSLYITDNENLRVIEKGAIGHIGYFEEIHIVNTSLNDMDSILDGVYKVMALRLNHNNLSKVPKLSSTLTTVEKMRLDNNQISELKKGDFSKGFNNLKILWLNYNNLSQIEPGSFQGLSNLKNLYMNANNLTWLDHLIFLDLPKVGKIGLEDNPNLKYTSFDYYNAINLNFSNDSICTDLQSAMNNHDIFESLPDWVNLNRDSHSKKFEVDVTESQWRGDNFCHDIDLSIPLHDSLEFQLYKLRSYYYF